MSLIHLIDQGMSEWSLDVTDISWNVIDGGHDFIDS
jgi:hypothetical protein